MKKILSLILIIWAGESFSASYDCKKAQKEVEKLICTSDELSSLDDSLNKYYKSVRNVLSDDSKTELEKEQRKWLTETRNNCKDIICISDAYANRLVVLELMRSGVKDESSRYCPDSVNKNEIEYCLSSIDGVLDRQIKDQLEEYIRLETSSENEEDGIATGRSQKIREASASAQQAWEQYRQSLCTDQVEWESIGGSGTGQFSLRCRIFLSKQRLQAIQTPGI